MIGQLDACQRQARAGLAATSTQTWGTTFVLAVVPKQRSHLVALPFCRAEPVVPCDQGVWLAVLTNLGPQSGHTNH